MSVSIILGHPDKSSFGHAIAETVLTSLKSRRYDVIFHDLYAENFSPLLPREEMPKDALLPADIELHCSQIREAEGIVIIHPDWWGQPPAILKGWVDRVLRAGVAYQFTENDNGEGVPMGLLKASAAIVFNTSNTPQVREQTVFGDPLETIWKNCIFELCGVHNFYRKNFGVVITSTLEQRINWLNEAAGITKHFFP